MFKKALAHQSNATPLRSSARRALVAQVFAAFPALQDSVAREGEPGLSEKDLGRALIPEGVRTAAIETSGGIDGTLYLSADGDALWMTLGRGSKELIPTLTLLAPATLPPFLPVLQLHYPLPPPLFTGAPLFLPAVRHMATPWRLPDVGEGELVALAADKGDGGVTYVGIARVVAKGGLKEALERLLKHRSEGVEVDEGKFADILTITDDHLWEAGSKPSPQAFPLPTPRNPLVPLPASEAPTPKADSDNGADAAADGVAALSVSEETPAVDAAEPLSPAEVSTLLSAALLQVLSSPPAFPIPSSQLYSAHILPNRPAYIPAARRDDVVISRSEWKKLAKWMKEASKEGILKVKESKGEVVVTGYDAKHPAVTDHVTFLTVGEEEAKAAKRAAREAAVADAPAGTQPSKSGGREMAIAELWRPSGTAVDLWAACGIEKDTLSAPAAIKPTVDAYIEKNGLVDAADKRIVKLDKTIASAVKAKDGERLHRDEVVRRLRAGVAWSVSVGGVVKKGTLNPITMSVKTRQGRKQVTLVANLEGFGIDVDDFADELRRLCAGSASVQPLMGASPKLNLKEVLVQGSQCKLVTEALIGRGVPKRYIKEGEGDKRKK